jgi:hypothetical protein
MFFIWLGTARSVNVIWLISANQGNLVFTGGGYLRAYVDSRFPKYYLASGKVRYRNVFRELRVFY